MTNKKRNNSEKAINELEKLFALNLLPETLEEAREILNDADIDTTDLKKEGREILRDILVEFEDDWRNVPDEVLENESTNILKRELVSGISRRTIIEKIKNIAKKISEKGLSPSRTPGLAYRNLDEDSDEDLASLLRQIEYIAEEAGIDLGEE